MRKEVEGKIFIMSRRASRLLITIILMWIIYPAITVSAIFDEKELAKYLQDEPHKIFEHPKIACYISSILPKEDYKTLRTNMTQMELFGKVDNLGGHVFYGWIRGMVTIAEGIVVIRPDGAVWIGLLNDEQFKYYTNQPNYYTSLPPSVKAWSEMKPEPRYMSFTSKPTVGKTELRCSDQKLSYELSQFYLRGRGELCDLQSQLSLDARRVVVTDKDDKAYFYSYKRDCDDKASCFERQGRYLIANDLVELAEQQLAKCEFQCVHYTHESGKKTAGWISSANLELIDKKDAIVDSRAVSDLREWTGQWLRQSDTVYEAKLNIVQKDSSQLRTTGFAISGSHTGELDGTFSVQGDCASGEKDVTEFEGIQCVPGVKMWRFNNAMYVSDQGDCGGIGVTFSGVYFKGRK